MAHPQINLRWLSLLFVALLCMLPTYAFAQSALQTAAQLSNGALDDYDNFELEDADAKIMQATHILEQNNVTDVKAAKIYIVQGIISYGRFKDSAPAIADERAFSAFLNAMTIDPSVEIPSDYKSEEIEEVFERAKATFEAAPKSSAAALSAVKPSVNHTAVTSANRCQALEIRATVPAHPDIYRVYLYYAVDDQRGYTQTELHPTLASSDILTADIPALDTRGNKIQYYIEAQNRMGEVVAGVANPNAPLTSVLVGQCTGLSAEELDKTYGDPLFQFSILFGTGFGVVEGKVLNCLNSSKCPTNTANNDGTEVKVTTGMAILPFHLRASGVFNLPYNIQLGFYLRGQLADIVSKTLSNPKNVENPEIYNIMLGLTLRYLALHTQPYRLYIGAEIGWGGSNAEVPLGSKYNNFVDIYLYEGPIHIAPEIGFLWTFHQNVGLAVELAIPIHFPKKPSVHFDLSVGPFFQF